MIFLNQKPIELGLFASGEQYIKLYPEDLKDIYDFHIDWFYGSDADYVALALLANKLREYEETVSREVSIHLKAHYLPNARMDRRGSETMPFSLKYTNAILNSLPIDTIAILSPHSEKYSYGIDKHLIIKKDIEHLLVDNLCDELGLQPSHVVLVFPDKGAYDRYKSMFYAYTCVHLDKKRDFATGKITSLGITTETIRVLNDDKRTAIIVDDICSYGGTVARCIDVIKPHVKEGIYLCVAHLESVYNKGALKDLLGNDLKGIYAGKTMDWQFHLEAPANVKLMEIDL